MLSVSEAERIILSLVRGLDSNQDTETVNLEAANGRILAQPVTSKLVSYGDVQGCNATNPITLNVVTEIAAGDRPQTKI